MIRGFELCRLRWFVVSLVLSIMTMTGTSTFGTDFYSNVLLNASFEQGAGETTVNNWELFSNANRYSGTAHSGNYALCTWGAYWTGHWGGSGAGQFYPVQGEQIWEATVWAMTESGITNLAYAALNIEFYDAQTQQLYTGTSAIRVDEEFPKNQWIKLSVKASTYRNTAFIRVVPVFIQSPAREGGSAWFDDCELYRVPASYIDFAGRTWQVADWPGTPGANYFSTNCVSVDTNGWLHMEVKKINGQWHCPAMETTNSLGFGEYRWYVETPLERLDSNLVVGLFTYASEQTYGTNQNEVDIEVSHAFEGTQTNCLLYTVQPYTINGNGYQHTLETTNNITTQRFFWRPDRIDFQSYYGHTGEPLDEQFLAGWRFNRRGIPIETNERAMMNVWLFETNAPASTQCLEMVIRDFVFVPFDGFILQDEFDDAERSNQWIAVGNEADVSEANGRLTVTPTSASEPAGYQTVEYVHRNERGTRYVFSARLAAVDIITPSEGDDIMAWLSLSVATNQTPFESPAAIILQGCYDCETDCLVFGLYTKTTALNSLGTLCYEGSLSNVSSRLAAGGLDLRIELDPVNYCFDVRDTQGNPVEAALISGSASGLHQLGEKVNNGFWMVGAQRSDASSAGSVSWDRTVIGIPDQSVNAFEVYPSVSPDGNIALSMPGCFDARCTVYQTTNLSEAFIPVASNIPVQSASMVITNVSKNVQRAYYRVKMEE